MDADQRAIGTTCRNWRLLSDGKLKSTVVTGWTSATTRYKSTRRSPAPVIGKERTNSNSDRATACRNSPWPGTQLGLLSISIATQRHPHRVSRRVTTSSVELTFDF